MNLASSIKSFRANYCSIIKFHRGSGEENLTSNHWLSSFWFIATNYVSEPLMRSYRKWSPLYTSPSWWWSELKTPQKSKSYYIHTSTGWWNSAASWAGPGQCFVFPYVQSSRRINPRLHEHMSEAGRPGSWKGSRASVSPGLLSIAM